MFSMTEKQKAALQAVADKPGPMAIVHFGKLRDVGFITPHVGLNINRGYAGAQITEAGLGAL
jgi:hypothetical protein